MRAHILGICETRRATTRRLIAPPAMLHSSPGERMDEADASGEAPEGVFYAYRPSVMGGICAFRVAPDALHWQIGRHSGALAYRDIRRIRLSFRPISLANYRFITELWTDALPKMIISSTAWKNIFEQQRQDAEYLAFIRALHEQIARAGATPRLDIGSPPLIYWPGVVLTALLFAVIPVVTYRTAQTGATGATLLLAAFSLFCVWKMGSFFYRNRPGTYAARALPDRVLPRSDLSPDT